MVPAVLRLTVAPPGPYMPGDRVRFTVALVDPTSGIDVPVDPDALAVRVQPPPSEGAARLPAELTANWPSGGVTKPVDSNLAPIVGSFYLDVTIDRPGTWVARAEATGAAVAANEVVLGVDRSALMDP